MTKLFLLFALFSIFNGSFVFAEELPQDPCNGKDCYRIELRESLGQDNNEITGRTGMELTKNYIAIIYKYGASLIGIICVLLIVFSGIQIITGGADAENVTQAKTRIFNSLLSLILLFMSAMILKSINPGFFRHGRNSDNIVIGLDGTPIPISALCEFETPPSCYDENGRTDPCDADGEELCIALGGTAGSTNCVRSLQNFLSIKNSFADLSECSALGNVIDGAYGNCTVAAFNKWKAGSDCK